MTVTTRLTAAALGLGTALMMAMHAGADYAKARSLGTGTNDRPGPLENVERLTAFPPGFRFTGSSYRVDPRSNRARLEVSAEDAGREVMAGSLSVRGLRLDPSLQTLIYEREGRSAVCARVIPKGAPWSRYHRVRTTGNCEVRPAKGEDGALVLNLAVRFSAPASSARLACR